MGKATQKKQDLNRNHIRRSRARRIGNKGYKGGRAINDVRTPNVRKSHRFSLRQLQEKACTFSFIVK